MSSDLQALWNWFVTSSSDPKKYSLALVGVLTAFGSYALQLLQVTCLLGILCLAIEPNDLTNIISSIGTFAEALFMAIGAALAVIGFVRKILNGRWTAAQ